MHNGLPQRHLYILITSGKGVVTAEKVDGVIHTDPQCDHRHHCGTDIQRDIVLPHHPKQHHNREEVREQRQQPCTQINKQQ